MELHIFRNVDEAITSLADYFVQHLHSQITDNGSCTVVLSGGKSPKNFYNLLNSSAYCDQLDWSKMYFFIGDERYVPFEDEASNGGMIKKFFADPLNVPEANMFYFNTSVSPEESAREYDQRIREFFGEKPVAFDLILLGLGDNAHTASLFPHTAVLKEKEKTVKAVFLEDQDQWRLTMTAPMINDAEAIAFLVYGQTKAEAVHHVLNGSGDPDNYPAQLIRPENAVVHWFLDEAASTLLKND
ncbi:6-phosphogluconolactonase [Pollutibacter soli]|uniref:6-phosphogluconolactonase n=1 Tax=Pollutibacter soli TaxID=3034157 RepID=UPI0030137C7D